MTGFQPLNGARRNIVAQLWTGDISLGKTYWLYGVLVATVMRLLTPLMTYEIQSHADNIDMRAARLIPYLWFGITASYGLFAVVAIWRSARKYKTRHPNRSINAYLAQGMCIFGIINLITVNAPKFLQKGTYIPASNAASPYKRLQYNALINGLNANLPKKVDDLTMMTKIDVDKSEFRFFMTVQVNIDHKKDFLDKLKPSILEIICKDPAALPNLENGVTYKYIYSDLNGNLIGDVVTTMRDCSI